MEEGPPQTEELHQDLQPEVGWLSPGGLTEVAGGRWSRGMVSSEELTSCQSWRINVPVGLGKRRLPLDSPQGEETGLRVPGLQRREGQSQLRIPGRDWDAGKLRW
jgi:hypothetical protein